MSLTNFIKRPDVASGLRERISSPKDILGSKISFPADMLCPPPASYSRGRFPLAGTASDYLIRLGLRIMNPDSKERQWVATSMTELLNNINWDPGREEWQVTRETSPGTDVSMPLYLHPFFRNAPELDWDMIRDKANTIHDKAVSEYSKALTSGKATKALAQSCVRLSQLDYIYRIGGQGLMGATLDPLHDEANVAEDILNIYNHVPWDNLKSDHHCILNPTFGEASKLVGGADADLVIDGCLIDIKTVQNSKSGLIQHLHQLAGYFALSQIGSINGNHLDINSVGIYYSRHATLVKIPVDKLIIGDINEFLTWFSDIA